MSKTEVAEEGATIRARNVGGISETTVDVPPGVTVLSGRNATNRTSFLQAIMAALGSDSASLKGDAEEGAVDLVMDEETYHRSLHRSGGTVTLRGEPYLDDSTVADLFAFLLESNEARQAVVRGDDLRELIMRPVDTDEIQNEIDRLERERDEVERELDELDSLKDELPSLERRKQRIESEIEEKRETLAAKTEEIESMDAGIEETRQEKRELESRLEDLRDLRSKLENVRADIDLQQESLKSLRNERAELRTDREELSEEPTDERRELDRTLSRLRERKQGLEARISDLQNVIQFNEEMLSGEETVVSEAFTDEDGPSDDLTDQLVEAEPVVCWTCGSEVERERIEETLDTVRSIRKDHVEEIRDIETRLEELREEKREREREQRRRDELEGKLADVDDEIQRRESRLETLRERRDQLSADVEAVEAEIDALETADFSGILDLHKEANQLEFELGRLESDLEDVTDRIGTIESQLEAEPDLEERRERIRNDLEVQRTRIDRIEREAVEEFNSCMEEVLELLRYDNLERIWIERVQTTDRRGDGDRTAFQIHVVRSTDSGTSYEDTIDHLSESEREVTGLTFALAGYLVHEVHETVPFMLLDSLEAIDSERLAEFVSFFDSYAEYLVVALLPEDAQALSDDYTYVTGI
jgi:DNA repair exonuclease SbcCD ATPase subunit